jgi:RNA polymerase sigma-70 factor (ECF subfamily)
MMANVRSLPFRWPALPLRLPMGVAGKDRAGAADASEARRVEESDWIRRARGGDPEGFRQLVDRYRDLTYEVALRIVRSPEEAEEVTQDAFVRAWRAIGGFREESRFSTWLYRIVSRRALDAAATARRRRERIGDPVEVETLPDPAAGRAPNVTDSLRLERILEDLAPVRRAVVTLFYLRERSVDEVAEILEMPAGTVKTHLYRARADLRRAWNRRKAQEKRSGMPEL